MRLRANVGVFWVTVHKRFREWTDGSDLESFLAAIGDLEVSLCPRRRDEVIEDRFPCAPAALTLKDGQAAGRAQVHGSWFEAGHPHRGGAANPSEDRTKKCGNKAGLALTSCTWHRADLHENGCVHETRSLRASMAAG